MLAIVFAALADTSGDASKKSGGPSSGAALPAVNVSAAAVPSSAVPACTKLDGTLPLTLGRLAGRPVHSDGQFVHAWGDPAVVLQCGVGKPAAIHPGSDAQFILVAPASGAAGAYFDVTQQGSDSIYTSVDRSVYVRVTVPASYHAAPMPALAGAIAAALPAVCDGDGTDPDLSKICARRKN